MTLDSSKLKNRYHLLLIAFAIIFLLGVYLRIKLIGRNLEYDEIWTLLHYSLKSLSEIFTNLSTPNNHPINSLLIKYSISLFGAETAVLRIPALISGIFILILAPALTFLISRNKFAALLSMLLCALNSGLIYYSETGRGYELQTLLILMTAVLIVSLERKKPSPNLIASIILLTGIASILTIPTSILFLFPIISSHLIFLLLKTIKGTEAKSLIKNFINENWPVLISYTVLFVFCITWFGINYDQFKAGQSNGTSVTSIGELFAFSYSTLLTLVSLPVLLFSLFSWIGKNNRGIFISYIFFIIFPFAGAILFKQGPIRVYLPLIPILSIFASIGIASILRYLLKSRILICAQMVIFICAGIFLFNKVELDRFRWISPDWTTAVEMAYTNMPRNTYVCLPATSGYPVMFSAPTIFALEKERTPREEKLLLVNLVEGVPNKKTKQDTYSALFNGIDPFNRNTTNQILTFKTAPKIMDLSSEIGCFAELYELKHINDSDLKTIGNCLFISLLTDGKKPINFGSEFRNIILLNLWFRENKFSGSHMTFIANNISLTKDELINIEKSTGAQVRFYTINPIPR
ncbi:MAG: hypothetical protein WCR55_08855 [Lentisphaerota bacterium]